MAITSLKFRNISDKNEFVCGITVPARAEVEVIGLVSESAYRRDQSIPKLLDAGKMKVIAISDNIGMAEMASAAEVLSFWTNDKLDDDTGVSKLDY
jgi:hypothetical protein